MTRRTWLARLVLTGGPVVSLAAGCGGAGTLSNTDLAKQVSQRYGPDKQHSRLVACYVPRDGATFNRVCYDPLSPSSKLYLRVTGQMWCVLWPMGKRATTCH